MFVQQAALDTSPEQPVFAIANAYAALPERVRIVMNQDLPIEIDCQAVRAKLRAGGDFLLVDCREPDEHALASIVDARLMPMSRLAAELEALAPYRDSEVAIHCHHGGRSLKVALWLREQGFARAQSMTGGIDVWSQEIDSAVPRY